MIYRFLAFLFLWFVLADSSKAQSSPPEAIPSLSEKVLVSVNLNHRMNIFDYETCYFTGPNAITLKKDQFLVIDIYGIESSKIPLADFYEEEENPLGLEGLKQWYYSSTVLQEVHFSTRLGSDSADQEIVLKAISPGKKNFVLTINDPNIVKVEPFTITITVPE